MANCEICERESADVEPPGGWVLRTDLWSACVAPGFDVPGWLFLELRRHAEGPMGMDDAEAAELGGLVRDLTAAVQSTLAAERVYVLAFGEVFPHFHVVLVPRMPFAPDDEKGAGLWNKRAELCDPPRAHELASAVRHALP
jgi:diadenosine tetraphosphate (Ap4A) HIT family hydrolase